MNSKLGYLCSSVSWGGLEMNHLRNAKWMQERGHNVLFFCIEDSPIAKAAEEMKLPIQFIIKHKKYYDFKAAKQLVRLINAHGITHLLIRSNHDMSIAATVKRKLNKSIHTSYFMEMQLGVKKKGIGHTIRYKYIDVWSCPLNWLEKQVQELTNFKNRLAVIPSGLALKTFESSITKEECRDRLELPKGALLFGLIGRLDPQKGQMLLLEAMLKSVNTDYHVVLLGEPTLNEGTSYADELNRFIEQNHLSNRVHIRPFMKDTSVFYKSIDWLVMATKAETFGMVTVEAFACGTPVLGSDAGGTTELISTEKRGLLFQTMNASDLAAKLDDIAENKVEVNMEQIREYAQRFDHSKVCKSVEELLNIRFPEKG